MTAIKKSLHLLFNSQLKRFLCNAQLFQYLYIHWKLTHHILLKITNI